MAFAVAFGEKFSTTFQIKSVSKAFQRWSTFNFDDFDGPADGAIRNSGRFSTITPDNERRSTRSSRSTRSTEAFSLRQTGPISARSLWAPRLSDDSPGEFPNRFISGTSGTSSLIRRLASSDGEISDVPNLRSSSSLSRYFSMAEMEQIREQIKADEDEAIEKLQELLDDCEEATVKYGEG